MTCFNTWTAYLIKNEDGSKEIKFKAPEHCPYRQLELPCGHCIGCTLDKASDYATRCYLESLGWENNCFVTLTYDNEHLPENGLLKKRDLQLFMKKLRYYHKGIESITVKKTKIIQKNKKKYKIEIEKEEYPIRFLACGEYGPDGATHRPHYHVLLFNWKPKNLEFYKRNRDGQIIYKCKELQKIWGNGFITVEDFNYRTACYVSRYISKKLFHDKTTRAIAKKMEIQPEFIDLSRRPGIGFKYWNEYKEQILKQEGVLLNSGGKVKHKPIPKYFERKYKEEIGDDEYEKYTRKKEIKAKKRIQEILKNTSLNESEYKRMQERQLIEKAKLLHRDNFI